MDELERRLDRIESSLEVLKKDYANLKELVENQQKILFGNGAVDGILTKLAITDKKISELSDKIDNLNKSIADLNTTIKKSNNKIYTAILTTIAIIDGIVAITVAIFH